jgi:hypothetical protein
MSPPTVKRRACIAIIIATASLLGLAPATEAKTPKCKRGQIVLKVNRKSVCRATKSVFPPAKAGDEVQIGFKNALAFSPPRAHGKRIRTLSSVLGRKRAAAVRRKLLKALPRLLARTRLTARAAADSDCAQNFSDFQENLNGGSLGVQNGQGQISATAGAGQTVSVTFPASNCNRFKAPPCPTAAGIVDGQDQRGREFRMLVVDNGKVVLNEVFSDTAKTTLHGQVAADAKLDFLQIDDVLTHVAKLGGSSHSVNYSETGTVTRSTRVDMRSGAQTPVDAVMKVVSRLDGQSPGAAYEEIRGYELLVASATDFAAMVANETSRYRALETGWNAANACAHIDWSPAIDTLTLHKDDHGQASGTITASGGGTAAGGVTTIVSQSNGTFSPNQANGGTPTFAYTVTSPDAGVLALAVQATSTAGVASSSWTQPIASSEWKVRQISGTFSGVSYDGGVSTSWHGSATWIRAKNLDLQQVFRAFTLVSGSYTATVSGTDGAGCHESGTHVFTMVPDPGHVAIQVFNPAADVVFGAGKPDWQLPWDYFWETTATTESTMDVVLSGCDDPHQDGTYKAGPGKGAGGGLPGNTPDGFAFSGSFTSPPDTDGGNETWDFTGTE